MYHLINVERNKSHSPMNHKCWKQQVSEKQSQDQYVNKIIHKKSSISHTTFFNKGIKSKSWLTGTNVYHKKICYMFTTVSFPFDQKISKCRPFLESVRIHNIKIKFWTLIDYFTTLINNEQHKSSQLPVKICWFVLYIQYILTLNQNLILDFFSLWDKLSSQDKW